MVKTNLPSSDNQATSIGRVSASRMGAYESAMQALGSFIGAEGLSGQAYDNAKDYAASTLLPLLKAAILYEESLSEAVKRLPSDYRATEYLEGKSLDSDVLEAELARLESVGMRLDRSIDHALAMARDYPDYEWHAHSMMRQLNQVIDRKNKVRRQLQALYAFNERSSSFFSGIGDLETQLSQGISQVGSDMSNFSGSFPSGLSPVWVSKVNQKWNDRVKRMRDTSSPADFRKLDQKSQEEYIKSVDVERAYQDLAKKVEKGEALTKEDIAVINAYAKRHPDVKPPKKVVEALDEYYYGFDDIPETLISKLTDMYEWGWATFGKMLDDANEVAIKQGKNLGRVFGAKLQPRDAFGRFVKDTIKPRSWLSGKLKGMSNGTSKIIGHGAKILGFGVSAFLEGADHYSKYKNAGRAVSYGITGGTVAAGAGMVAGAIGSALALPAIGTLAVGLAVGVVASAGLKAAYENIKPVRDAIDGVGDLFNKGGKAVSDGFKSIGKAFSNPIGSLKGAFEW
ncbi:T7SS effector LXG polymorphic toxin [Streptococcus suis]|uniref:T7SS effector LXG polymorphic toxin n=1 Tax=Streptococcus suis TaxID=1307 RepID=UPI0019620DDF|nr:T7SS effector LXG polymorphic toxin [Streptococcus suis]MBM7192298.1 hypothetical protein [Streptococcus suis]MCO8224560.1 LXG domain-containing protein [Streptococcus suis]HEM3486291.1 hypothetical protein [Streptococcus suis]